MSDWAEALFVAAIIAAFVVWGTFIILWVWQ